MDHMILLVIVLVVLVFLAFVRTRDDLGRKRRH